MRNLFDEENILNTEDDCSDIGVLSVTTTLVGTIMASECLKLILNIDEGLLGKLLMLDLLNLKFETIKYK
jgi:molybdopterin/thiamine biosynthesis adenylyltransferase